jgi:hypothetical protein
MIKEPAADGLIKIIVLGDSGVGKSKEFLFRVLFEFLILFAKKRLDSFTIC